MLNQEEQNNKHSKRILAIVPDEFHSTVKEYAKKQRVSIADVVIASVQLVIDRGFPIREVTKRELRVEIGALGDGDVQ